MLSIIVKEEEFCCIQFRFVIGSKTLTRFCVFNFLAVCHAAKKKCNFLFSYKLYTRSLVLFAGIF